MDLDLLILQKAEIPILRKTSFLVPIYPWLLDERVIHDSQLAHRLFPQVAQEWYEDMRAYIAGVEDREEKKWIQEVFIPSKPEIREEHGQQVIYPGGFWSDLVRNEENGFASALSINRNVGGTLFINPPEQRPEYLCPPLVNFSPEKFNVYTRPGYETEGLKGVNGFAYEHDNIDNAPGAFFLRNWALMYHNETLKAAWNVIAGLQKAGEKLRVVREKE